MNFNKSVGKMLYDDWKIDRLTERYIHHQLLQMVIIIKM